MGYLKTLRASSKIWEKLLSNNLCVWLTVLIVLFENQITKKDKLLFNEFLFLFFYFFGFPFIFIPLTQIDPTLLDPTAQDGPNRLGQLQLLNLHLHAQLKGHVDHSCRRGVSSDHKEG